MNFKIGTSRITMYHQEKTRHYFFICRHEYFTPAMRAFLKDPDAFLRKNSIRYIKKQVGEPTTVAVVTVDGRPFVLKRYNLNGFWHAMKRLLQRNRAWRSWKNSLYLEKQDIATPKAVAVVAKYRWRIRQETYFLTEYVSGLSGHELFFRKNYSEDKLKRVIENIGKLLKKLYAARVSHDDFHHSNMVFVHHVPVLLDLDHMRIHCCNTTWFRYNFRKDVKNFLRILHQINPTASEMARSILASFP